jgi:hypothetical protein
MSKKTLALVAGLTVLTLVLVILALNTGSKAPKEQPGTTPTASPEPTVPAHSIINLSPNPVTLTGNSGTVDVMIDTSDNQATGAQFDLVYDPAVLTVGPLKQGDFFTNAIVLLNDTKTPGKVTYMIGLTPAGAKSPRSGTGTIATFTVTRKSTAAANGTSELKLENVYVSAKDIKPSVLKSASGTTVNLTAGTAAPAASSSSH